MALGPLTVQIGFSQYPELSGLCVFYLLELQEKCWPYFAFRRPVDAFALGGTWGSRAYVCPRVPPMGYPAATAVLYYSHRRLALGRLPRSLEAGLPGVPEAHEIRQGRPMPFLALSGDRREWKIYLDDFLGLDVLTDGRA